MERGELIADRYRLTKRIARGGMGEVWEAWDDRLHRDVAVKLLAVDDTVPAELLRRFESEARAAARITHPNVVTVHDNGPHGDDALFLVMEKVEGVTLTQHLRTEGPLSPGRALAVAEDVCSALHAAHQAKVIHYDVTPQNVMLTSGGQVKVVDFGIAGFVQATYSASVTGTAEPGPAGTPAYGAPEQFVEGGGDVRSDLYGLGSVLFVMLTGEPPFTGPSPFAVMQRKLNEPAPRLDRVRKGLPAGVVSLVARLLERAPGQRPKSAEEVLAEIRRLRDGREPQQPAPRPGSTWSWDRVRAQLVSRLPDRKPPVPVPLGALRELRQRLRQELTSTTSTSWLSPPPARDGSTAVLPGGPDTTPPPPRMPRTVRTPRWRWSRAGRALWSRRVRRAAVLLLLTQLVILGVAAIRLALEVDARWSFDTGSPITAAPAVAGGRVYVGDTGGRVHALDASSGRELWRYDAEEGVRFDDSPLVGGRFVYVSGSDGRVRALGVADGRQKWVADLATSKAPGVARTSGGLYAVTVGGEVAALDPGTGKVRWKASVSAPGESVVAGRSGGGDVVAVGGNSGLYGLSGATGRRLWVDGGYGDTYGRPGFADGRIYVRNTYTSVTQALDPRTGRTVWKADDCSDTGGLVAAPAVVDHTVYTEVDGRFGALDAPSGKCLWETGDDGGSDGDDDDSADDADDNGNTPAVTGGVAVVAAHGHAVAVDAETGDDRWRTDLHTDGDTPAAAGHGSVFVGTEEGTLYALDAETGRKPKDWQ